MSFVRDLAYWYGFLEPDHEQAVDKLKSTAQKVKELTASVMALSAELGECHGEKSKLTAEIDSLKASK